MFDPGESGTNDDLIAPHGGHLIDRQLDTEASQAAQAQAVNLAQVELSPAAMADIEMISCGAYSPLTGFMGQADYERVVKEMRLTNNLVWPIPITLPVKDEQARRIREGDEIALMYGDRVVAIMQVAEKFHYDKRHEACEVYQTEKCEHPGVARLQEQGNTLLGGEIWTIDLPWAQHFREWRHTPAKTRQIFVKKNWHRVVGFQTRNPIHRAHEYILQHALKVGDGLFFHPLVGETRPGEISAQARVESYWNLLYYCYPRDRVLLSVFPAAMRYAGPREAILHALCRKNYGCTHFVVGHDHAGVGNFYKPTAACDIFKNYSPGEIGIEIISSPEIKCYCRKCRQVVVPSDCPHNQNPNRLSGTEIREMLAQGKMPPPEIMRPEVSWMLLKAMVGNKSTRPYLNFVRYLLRNNPKGIIISLKLKLPSKFGPKFNSILC